jgi:hypothetical protein
MMSIYLFIPGIGSRIEAALFALSIVNYKDDSLGGQKAIYFFNFKVFHVINSPFCTIPFHTSTTSLS